MLSTADGSVSLIPAQTRAHVQLPPTTLQIVLSLNLALRRHARALRTLGARAHGALLPRHARRALDAIEKIAQRTGARFRHSAPRRALTFARLSRARMRERGDADDADASDASTERVGALALVPARQRARVSSLCLRANGLSNLRDVAALARARALDVSDNRLTSLDDLSACGRELRALDASGNAIRSIAGCARWAGALRRLSLRDNCVRDRSIGAFASLVELDLSRNGLEELPDCSRCPALRVVRLRGNSISSLAGASDALPATTTHLDLRENDLADVEEFAHLRYFPRLTDLWFAGNPVDARAVHYGYDARAVVAFCAPAIRSVDGERAFGSSWAIAGRQLFRNDAGEICEELLAMLTERAAPWVLGEYLRSVCGRAEAPKRGAERERSAMFTVSSFVPVSGSVETDEDESDDDFMNADGETDFVVDVARTYVDPNSELDNTAHWLSQLVSESGDEQESEDESGHESGHESEGLHPFGMDVLTDASPIRSTSKRSTHSPANEDSTTEDDSSAGSGDFHSVDEEEEGEAVAKTPMIQATAAMSPLQKVMRLVRSSPRSSGPRKDSARGVADSQPSSNRAESIDDTPDLRPRASTRRKSFVFTDDSESFAASESFDALEDEEELSMRDFLLTGDDDGESHMSPNTKVRTKLRSVVDALAAESRARAGDGGTPERLARTARKIEAMIGELKRTRSNTG